MLNNISALIMLGTFRADFPRSRVPSGLLIEEEHDRPDLVLGQKLFPRRHRRIPRCAFARQPGSAFRDAPEHEAFRELGDRAVVLEVRGERVQPRGKVTLPVEMVAVARDAVLIVDAMAFSDVRREVAPPRAP